MASNHPSDTLICANCQGHGHLACSGCLTVLYCGSGCQKAHWSTHKATCKSPLSKSTWKPGWAMQQRTPTHYKEGTYLGGNKYFFGNKPAIDVVQLVGNEGTHYGEDLNVLVAASGDLRNVIKAIVSLPETYSGTINLVINDHEFEIVARNVSILLIGLTCEDEEQGVDCMVHLWYSAFIKQSHADLLKKTASMVEDVIRNSQDQAPETIYTETLTSNVRLALTRSQWQNLLRYLVQSPVTLGRAKTIRAATMLAVKRKDYREILLLGVPPAYRTSVARFQEDGILLPFGISRVDFATPNPTFFPADEWPMQDTVRPLQGWNISEIINTCSGLAMNDFYGKMYYFLKAIFRDLRRCVLSRRCEFQFFNLEAQQLGKHLKGSTFARIETSNIADEAYLGISKTIRHLSPLLQKPGDNPHATLLTQFPQAVVEMESTMLDRNEKEARLQRAQEYLPFPSRPTSEYDTHAMLVRLTSLCLRDEEKLFQKYMSHVNSKKVEIDSKFAIKKKNSIVDMWPAKLKLGPHDAGGKEELTRLLFCAEGGPYLEWKRTT